jgi:hypothetical protein
MHTPHRPLPPRGRSRLPWMGSLLTLLVLAACQGMDSPTSPMGPEGDARLAPQDEVAAFRGAAPQEVGAWFRAASPEVMALEGTVRSHLDLERNRMFFGIEQAGRAFAVNRVLQARGIPAAAYTIEVVEPIRFMSDNLRSAHRPVVAGVQLHWGQYVCTLGFNVDHAGGRSFITNSHCTNNQGSTGSTTYFQPLSSTNPTAIAVEAHDPAYVRNAPGCSRGKVCRMSDAARALYQPGTESTRGRIAKTTGANNGSLQVEGHFTITAQDNATTSFAAGTTFHKVGRTTGWTSGTLQATCSTVNVSGTNIQLLCQTTVTSSGERIVQGGDSGSPVFTRGSGDNVTLVGILWGGSTSGSLFVFSPFKQVQDELGGMTATFDGAPPPGDDNGDDEEPAPCIPRGPNGNNCK